MPEPSSNTLSGFPLSDPMIDAYEGRSAALGAILRGAELARIVAAYKREDQRAIDAQGQFFDVAKHLNASVLATAIVSALMLALGLLQPSLASTWIGRAIPWILLMLGLAGLLIGGYATARLYELNAGDLAGDWMRSRARAEQLRSKYFDRLVERVAAANAEAKEAALDLVNRHLLEDQLDYFGKRGKRHEMAAVKWLRWAAFSSGVASVGVAAGGMGGTAGEPWILAIAALGAIGGAGTAFAAGQETIGQEKERAQRFRNNADALEQLATKIDEVRDAVRAGPPDTLITFTSAINQQLALELGRFLEGGESIRASIDRLSQQIDESRRTRKGNDPNPVAPGG